MLSRCTALEHSAAAERKAGRMECRQLRWPRGLGATQKREKKTTSAQALGLAHNLLDALHARDIEKAYRFRNRLLQEGSVDSWIRSPKQDLAIVLYALGQILSRKCCFDEPSGRECQLERLDKKLALVHPRISGGSPAFIGCTLATTAYLSFYLGVSALHRKEYERAKGCFADALRDAERLEDYDLQANAHFFLATCNRKLDPERDAVEFHLRQSVQALEKLPKAGERILVVEVHIAWEIFRSGDFGQAEEIARKTIKNFGTDFATRAHAYALLARIERRRQHYAIALELINKAVRNFRKRDPYHRALARGYANQAHTMILIAQQTKLSKLREKLLNQAIKSLKNADQIYQHRHYDQQSRPEVDNLRAMAAYCKKEFITAYDMAELAFSDATARKDYVEMSTARIIQCMCRLSQPPPCLKIRQGSYSQAQGRGKGARSGSRSNGGG